MCVGGIGQLSPYPPHCADLELMLDQDYVYIFPGHCGAVYTYCSRVRRETFGVADVHSTRAAEMPRLVLDSCLSNFESFSSDITEHSGQISSSAALFYQ